MDLQGELGGLLQESARLHRKSILKYGRENKRAYVKAARALDSNLKGPERETRIRERIAFAILSANAPFDSTVEALSYAHKVGLGAVEEQTLAKFRMVPFKARAIRELASRPIRDLVRGRGERWDAYRERLMRTTPGLGRAKAAFAVSLLYPTTADVACLDTWMCKVYLGTDAFKSLRREQYEQVESEVRKVRNALALPSTFLAQWIIWDYARGEKVNAHAVFPGMHKSEAEPPPF